MHAAAAAAAVVSIDAGNAGKKANAAVAGVGRRRTANAAGTTAAPTLEAAVAN